MVDDKFTFILQFTHKKFNRYGIVINILMASIDNKKEAPDKSREPPLFI